MQSLSKKTLFWWIYLRFFQKLPLKQWIKFVHKVFTFFSRKKNSTVWKFSCIFPLVSSAVFHKQHCLLSKLINPKRLWTTLNCLFSRRGWDWEVCTRPVLVGKMLFAGNRTRIGSIFEKTGLAQALVLFFQK